MMERSFSTWSSSISPFFAWLFKWHLRLLSSFPHTGQSRLAWCCHFPVWGTVIFWMSSSTGSTSTTCCLGFFLGGIDGLDLVLPFTVWKTSCSTSTNLGPGLFFDARDGLHLILASGQLLQSLSSVSSLFLGWLVAGVVIFI